MAQKKCDPQRCWRVAARSDVLAAAEIYSDGQGHYFEIDQALAIARDMLLQHGASEVFVLDATGCPILKLHD